MTSPPSESPTVQVPAPLTAFALLVGVGLIVPIAGHQILDALVPGRHWEVIAFHAVVEAAGGLTAFAVASLLFLRESTPRLRESDVWIAAALMGLGVLDTAHAAVRPGHLFVWLHSAATLVGGALFAACWLPAKASAAARRVHLPLLAAIGASVLVIIGVASPQSIPEMLGPHGFTGGARALNMIGGLAFFLAAVRFFGTYLAIRTWDDLLFAVHCALFGAAGLLFELSQLWDGSWWWWHALRLAAYAVALAYLFLDYWRSGAREAELNVALDAANRELEMRVQERTRQLEATYEELKREAEHRQRLEAQRFEARLRHTQKLEGLGVLAGGIAHDFNNLLVAVLGNADLALTRTEPEHPAYPLLERVVAASTRASDLTNQMLAYSGRGRFQLEDVDLSELVREMSELLEVGAGGRVTLKLELDPDLPPVTGDVTQLRQVVMNLITNASDAIETHGVVSLRTDAIDADEALLAECEVVQDLAPGRFVRVEVADEGCGMDDATRARMFDPFFTTKATGRGLGLAATLGIVRGHGGALRVVSTPGEGTTIQVLLPLADQADRTATRARPDTGPSPDTPAPGRILFADDNAAVRELAESAMESVGFEVVTAADGRECVDRYEADERGFALVVLDVTMPVLDGHEALQELVALDPAVRVLMSSGYDGQGADLAGLGACRQVKGFLKKPYTLEQLRDALFAAVAPESRPAAARE